MQYEPGDQVWVQEKGALRQPGEVVGPAPRSDEVLVKVGTSPIWNYKEQEVSPR